LIIFAKNNKSMTKISRVMVFMLIAILVSCNNRSSSGDNGTTLEGSIKIDGSSTVFPITEAVAEEYRSEAPKVQITIGVSGTGGGFQKFGRGETDISNASRTIKESEIKLCEENDITYHGIMVAYDGMAILVNPENDWVSSITVEELNKVWEPDAQNTITRWNQIRPEWPDAELRLYGAGTASGTYDYFTKVIVGESGSSRGDFTASEDDNVLVQGIKSDVNALGFFGLAYYEENKEDLKLVPVDNGDGPVLPTTETVSNNSYDPLSRPIFIYVNSEAVKRAEVVDFINFYLSNAKLLCKEVGYVPLPDALYQKEQEKFDAFLKSSVQ